MQNEKIVLLKTKGFDGLDEAALTRKNATWEKFLVDGKAMWSFADYLGFSGLGKGAGKQADVIRQLSQQEDSPACRRTLELIPQIALRFETGPVTIESAPLRAYFTPYLKAHGESAPAVTSQSFEGLEKLNLLDLDI